LATHEPQLVFHERTTLGYGAFLFAKYPISGILVLMSQDRLIQLKNKETGEVYWSSKNKKKVERKIELKKFSKKLRKRITFKEAKK